jgi:hypothetical protein
MADRFIPNGDSDFLTMAGHFARTVAQDPAGCAQTAADAAALTAAAERFGAALRATRFGDRSVATTRRKDEARTEMERRIRKAVHQIRASDGVDAMTRFKLGLRERPARLKEQTCPNEPPRLTFVRALHEASGACPMHELKFGPANWNAKGRPAGAARLELFVDLVPPEEPIPVAPGDSSGGRPWYLRSYTRSPIVLAPPMARVPMRVVYWARWADAKGNVGPFSKCAPAWIEGGAMHLFKAPALGNRKDPVTVVEVAEPRRIASREPAYIVAVLEAQVELLNQQPVMEVPALPAPPPEVSERTPAEASEAA